MMDETMHHPPTIRKPTEGRRIGIVGDLYRFLARGERQTESTPPLRPSCLRVAVHLRTFTAEKKSRSSSLKAR